MPEKIVCPQCHTEVRASDYFCFNCGKGLKAKPLSTDIGQTLLILAGSLLLPPMGIVWGIRYLRTGDPKSKMVGTLAIVITIVSLILATIWTLKFIDSFNKQLNSQLDNLGGFY